MSSHILQEIQATVDRIIIINEGSIVADGSSDSLLSDTNAKTELSMEVENADENDINDMKAIIPSIDISSISKESTYTKINIKYPKNNDPRSDIFKYAVDKGWTILEMFATKQNLEDIFRNLTSSNESNNG